MIITTSGGTGDADVVAKYGGVPSDISGELSSDSYGNDERVTISNPQTGKVLFWFCSLSKSVHQVGSTELKHI